MALSQEEGKLAETLKKNGKSNTEIMRIIARQRSGGSVKQEEISPTPKKTMVERVGSFALGATKGLAESAIGTARLASLPGQGVLAAVDPTRTFADIQEGNPLFGEEGKRQDEMLKAKNADEMAGKVVTFGAEILAGGGAKLLQKGIQKIGSGVSSVGSSAVDATLGKIGSVDQAPEALSGAKQIVEEFADRVPRFLGRMRETTQEAAQRAERIRTSSPAVQKAISARVNDQIINTVEAADEPTLTAYKEMLDIAEDTKGGVLKAKQRPEIVAGRVAADQFEIIEKQRKAVGDEIGKTVDALSKTVKEPMEDSYQTLDTLLNSQGIGVTRGQTGTTLTFRNTGFTPQERTRIEELYRLATEGGDFLTPKQIRDKDQLFSKLQREARMEGVGDIIVETPVGKMSLFRIFRDVYADKLDTVAPNIKELNRAYRNIITLQDDIENSIIKAGNFQTTKGVDPAEFAQVNLRRLSSEAVSSPQYQAIVNEMDRVARELGYSGARADELALFANELRKLYPETIPKTGFTGSIRTGIADIIGKVSELGAPDVTDQQKALRELIESRLQSK